MNVDVTIDFADMKILNGELWNGPGAGAAAERCRF
jgi:hypothetical protein